MEEFECIEPEYNVTELDLGIYIYERNVCLALGDGNFTVIARMNPDRAMDIGQTIIKYAKGLQSRLN